MKFLEKDLEEIIYETYLKSPDRLVEKGVYINGKIKRQLRIGNYGIADLVTFKRDYEGEYDTFINDNKDGYNIRYVEKPTLIVTVYELKKDKVGISAYLQAVSYIKGLQEYFEARNFKFNIEFNIVLIGSIVDTSGSFCYLPSLSNNIKILTYSYDVDGIEFNNHNHYKLTDNGFKI